MNRLTIFLSWKLDELGLFNEEYWWRLQSYFRLAFLSHFLTEVDCSDIASSFAILKISHTLLILVLKIMILNLMHKPSD